MCSFSVKFENWIHISMSKKMTGCCFLFLSLCSCCCIPYGDWTNRNCHFVKAKTGEQSSIKNVDCYLWVKLKCNPFKAFIALVQSIITPFVKMWDSTQCYYDTVAMHLILQKLIQTIVTHTGRFLRTKVPQPTTDCTLLERNLIISYFVKNLAWFCILMKKIGWKLKEINWKWQTKMVKLKKWCVCGSVYICVCVCICDRRAAFSRP